ncbi:MAG: hypothetical protein CSYNP_01912 [Syntrophus sp. SKADARSKE-3]|nr:hypothetical protein [Syntrophus sp. SKADARSKE-3]
MSNKLIGVAFILTIFFSTNFAMAAGDIAPATMEKYRQIKSTLSQIAKAKEGIYAREIVESAQRTLARAQEEIDAKRDKSTREALNMAELQIEQAKAKVEEREAAERTAVTRSRVDKLEQRLSAILSGKGDEK